MKRLALIVLILFGVSRSDFAQGTISFQNFNPSTIGGRVWTNANEGIGDTNGGVLAPAGYHVELLYAPLSSPFSFASAVVFNNTTTGGGQFFDGATVTLLGIPAGLGNGDTNSVVFEIRGWTGAYSDYISASF